MKKSLQLSVSVALLLGVSSLFAAEAYSPSAYGAKARGMGGLGIGFIHGAESAFNNPALISYLQKDELSLGLTYLTSKNSFNVSDVVRISTGVFDIYFEEEMGMETKMEPRKKSPSEKREISEDMSNTDTGNAQE